jgi:hypothetical protein
VPSITASAISHLCAPAERSSAIWAAVALATRSYPAASHLLMTAPHAGEIAMVPVTPIVCWSFPKTHNYAPALTT